MFFVRAYLWFAPNLLLLVALLWIFHRKLHRQYAIFAAYLVLQLAYFATALTVDLLIPRHLASRNIYLWTLIFGLGLSAAAEMAVLYELAFALIFSRLKSNSLIKVVLRWTSGILVLIATILAASLAWTSTEHLINIFQTLNVVVYVIALGLLFAIIVLTTVLSIPWRSLNAGIALGFGISAAGELAGAGVLSEFGKSRGGYIAADLVRMSAFHVCALVWLIYVLFPEKPKFLETSPEQLSEIELRMQELQRIIR